MSSMNECKAIDFMAYRTSKAALNMMMTLAANELGPKGATVVLLHPGWVQTAMGGPNAAMTPKDGVSNAVSPLPASAARGPRGMSNRSCTPGHLGVTAPAT